MASVACPHNCTSMAGLNHRRSNLPPRGMTNAVSERLFSCAIAWSVASGSHSSSTTTRGGVSGGRVARERVDMKDRESQLRFLSDVGLDSSSWDGQLTE